MSDIIDRFVAFGAAPEIYDEPTLEECRAVAAELRTKRAAVDDLLAALENVKDIIIPNISHTSDPNGLFAVALEIDAAIAKATE